MDPNNFGLFAGDGRSLSYVAKRGDPTPGLPGGSFSSFDPPAMLTPNGTGVFTAWLGGPAIDPNFRTSGWMATAGAMILVARGGQVAPSGAGAVFKDVRSVSANDAGSVTLIAGLAGSGVTPASDAALYRGAPGSLSQLARRGDPAAGLPSLAYDFLLEPGINARGDVWWGGGVAGPGVGEYERSALWYAPRDAEPRLLVRSGDTAWQGNPGERYQAPRDMAMTGAGVIAFTTTFLQPPNFYSGMGIYGGTTDSFDLLVRTGTPVAQVPGAVHSQFWSLKQNERGDRAWMGVLAGIGVSAASDRAIFTNVSGLTRLVAREGEPAPGTDAVFGELDINSNDLRLNTAGQVAFVSPLTGSGITPANDLGIWATDPAGLLTKVAREGDLFEVGTGDIRVIASLDPFVTSLGLDDLGEVTFAARFTDGSSGIFIAAVPEPRWAAALLVAFWYFRRHNSRRPAGNG